MLPHYLISATYLSYCLNQNDLTVPVNSVYNKQYRLNRCTIASSQGSLILSVPLIHGRNQKSLLNEVLIDHRQKWSREHIHSLKTVYGKSPYYIHYCDKIYDLLQSNESHLLVMNIKLINHILDVLRISQRVVFTEQESYFTTTDVSTIQPLIYKQLFQDRTGFIPNCSILDVLFNYGPDTKQILLQQ
jgi:predicted ATPase